MRNAITIGVIRGSGKTDLIHGEETPLREQLDSLKTRIGSGTDEKFSEVKIYSSDEGVIKRARFESKATAKAKADAATAKAKAEAAAKAKADAEAKAQAAKSAKPKPATGEAKAQPATPK